MARKISFDDAATWYVPDIEGNRQDPDPFAVLLQPLSGAELAAYERSLIPPRANARGRSDDASIVARVEAMTDKLIADRVKQVINYEVVVVTDGKSLALRPTNGAELVDAVNRAPATERPLLLDILAALRDHSVLDEGARGNLSSPYVYAPQTTATSGGGGAGTAAAQAQADASTPRSATATAQGTVTTSASCGLLSSAGAPGRSSPSPTSSASPGGESGASSTSSPGAGTTSPSSPPS